MDVLRLTLRQLQIFAAIARTGTTTAAAADVALSQSATSAALNELERLLSLRLFDRTGRRLLLNDNGRALLPRAQALLDGAAQIERMARDTALQSEALRIGASMTIADHVLPGVLSEFLGGRPQSSPRWRSTAAVANTAGICRAVASFELDVGLTEGPGHEAALQTSPWLRDELLIVGASVRPAGEGKVPVSVLRDAVWLLREAGSGTREATDLLLLPHLRSYRRSIELGTNESIKHAAAAGLGFACLSRWVVQDMLRSGHLREIRTTLPPMVRQWHWVVHRDKQPTPALQRFLAVLAAMAAPASARPRPRS